MTTRMISGGVGARSAKTKSVRERIIRPVQSRITVFLRGDEGMSTAEYAIGTVAAAAFASLLYTVVTGDSVTTSLTSLIERALESSF